MAAQRWHATRHALLRSSAATALRLHPPADSDCVRPGRAALPCIRDARDHGSRPRGRLAARRPEASGSVLRIRPAASRPDPGRRRRQRDQGCRCRDALADIVPGRPVVINDTLQAIGGTSGSTPFIAAAVALVAASQRKAGRPRIGLVNGWFYKAASQRPPAFFDVTAGSNDLAGVGCCHATAGYDEASGLGVPNWVVLPGTLPGPGQVSSTAAMHPDATASAASPASQPASQRSPKTSLGNEV